jgi:hypothetical protein
MHAQNFLFFRMYIVESVHNIGKMRLHICKLIVPTFRESKLTVSVFVAVHSFDMTGTL